MTEGGDYDPPFIIRLRRLGDVFVIQLPRIKLSRWRICDGRSVRPNAKSPTRLCLNLSLRRSSSACLLVGRYAHVNAN